MNDRKHLVAAEVDKLIERKRWGQALTQDSDV
jgi:hypothetical protein